MDTTKTARPKAWKRPRRAARLFVALALLAGAGALGAAQTHLSYLEGKDPVAADAVTAYGNDLFGDRINLFNGTLEFVQTDLSLPGNHALPVALVRRHSPGQSLDVRGQFGDWDLDVPRIGGSFSHQLGWVTSSGGTTRCSGFSAPKAVSAPADGNSISFGSNDYWRGTFLHVPGAGAQEVLVRSAGYGDTPDDGGNYRLVTHANWQIACLGSIQNGAGDGFLALSPEGVSYRFDWMASRAQTDVKKTGAVLARRDVYLMATEVTDRFGNWVRYSYDAASPLLLKKIESSDGRVITITNSGGRAVSATDGTRTYQYSYAAGNHLSQATLPDGSRWAFNLAPMVPVEFELQGEGANCNFPGSFSQALLAGSIIHPSGATGSFTTQFKLLGRTEVDKYCKYLPNSTTLTYGAVYPKAVSTQALVAKSISGPGMAALNWSYAYVAPSGWKGCTGTSCPAGVRSISVTEPNGSVSRHLFGSRWRIDEGQLLQVDEGWNSDSATALRSTSYRYRAPASQNYPEQFGVSLLNNGDYLSSRHRPQDRRQITVQGSTFTWEAKAGADGFDEFARPKVVRKYSSLGFSRTETTTYHDNFTKWVLGQVAKVSETTGTPVEIERHDYAATSALRTASYSFGKKMESFAYNADGTLKTVRDPADRETRLATFVRGKPQTVTYPDGTSESQVIGNLGNVKSRTNAFGTTTAYQFDAMGRVTRVDYPAESSTVGYAPMTQAFVQIASSEYGIAAGHWRQTLQTGAAVTKRYYDALWRLRLEHRYDSGNVDGTQSFQETRYGTNGQRSFESYAARTLTGVDGNVAGRTFVYDAIGRRVTEKFSSELGTTPLQTSIHYPTDGFRHVLTDARGHSSTTLFQAFDTPSDENIIRIVTPADVKITINRDVFGKATAIGRASPTHSATRSYVYDAHQRLCKTVEPETGATVQAYDTANNVAWRASGLTTLSLTSRDQSSVAAARKVSFGYDSRNRLISTSYGDGSEGVSRTYTADSLPATVATPDFSWTYVYNKRRLLTRETLSTAQPASYAFTYGINANGHVSSLAYPGGPTVQYSPDAFGRPTQMSGYASAIGQHPNGALSGYTAANGIVFSMTQNTRGLPLRWKHAGLVQDLYAYDQNANVSAITDEQQAQTTRSMAYDALDRLTEASGIWGDASFGYDALDNLVTSTVGSRVLTHTMDPAKNRLSHISGSQNLSISYDANGNVVTGGSKAYAFDIGNRMTAAAGVASYFYDGHGRRAWTQTPAGRTVLSIYSRAGRLLLTVDSQKGTTRHIHLGDKLIAETNTSTGTRWLHTDALGSPVAATNSSGAVLTRTRYEPYGETAAGTDPDGIGFTGHVNDVATGLVYMQQRYYDPIAGRFLSVDPVTTDAKTGSSFNRYVYGNNNPYRFKDPDGRSALDIGFFVVDAFNFGVAVYTGVGIPAAAADLAASTMGLASPVPGVGQALKAVRTVDKVADVAKGVEKTASGKRVGGFTKSQREAAKAENAAANGGQMKCTDCGKAVESIKSEKGVPTHSITHNCRCAPSHA